MTHVFYRRPPLRWRHYRRRYYYDSLRAMDAMALIDAERQCTARGHDQHDPSLHDARCSVPHV